MPGKELEGTTATRLWERAPTLSDFPGASLGLQSGTWGPFLPPETSEPRPGLTVGEEGGPGEERPG